MKKGDEKCTADDLFVRIKPLDMQFDSDNLEESFFCMEAQQAYEAARDRWEACGNLITTTGATQCESCDAGTATQVVRCRTCCHRVLPHVQV